MGRDDNGRNGNVMIVVVIVVIGSVARGPRHLLLIDQGGVAARQTASTAAPTIKSTRFRQAALPADEVSARDIANRVIVVLVRGLNRRGHCDSKITERSPYCRTPNKIINMVLLVLLCCAHSRLRGHDDGR
jgi:hypothetical protein